MAESPAQSLQTIPQGPSNLNRLGGLCLAKGDVEIIVRSASLNAEPIQLISLRAISRSKGLNHDSVILAGVGRRNRVVGCKDFARSQESRVVSAADGRAQFALRCRLT